MNTREKENRRRRRGISMGEYLFLGALFLAFSVASLRLPSAILDWQDREMVGRRFPGSDCHCPGRYVPAGENASGE